MSLASVGSRSQGESQELQSVGGRSVTLDGNVLNTVFYKSGKVVIEKATRSECNVGEPLFSQPEKAA